MKQDEGGVLPKGVSMPSALLNIESFDMNENTSTNSQCSSISPERMNIHGEHNFDCEQQI